MSPRKNRPATFPPTIFNVFKPPGMGSFDVVRHFKRHLPEGYGKICHFGTLDPFAAGVLLIGIAGASKLNEFIHDDLPKTYLAIGKLGLSSPTGDHTSTLTKVDIPPELPGITKEQLQTKIREKFLGSYMQRPHAYSAAKINGVPLYKLARRGEFVEKDEVERYIYDITVVKFSFPYLSIRFKVTSGTYIRTLFSDVAKELSSDGILIGLVRESIGDTTLSDSIKKSNWPKERLANFMTKGISPEKILKYKEITVEADELRRLYHGMTISNINLDEGERVWARTSEGVAAALLIVDSNELRSLVSFSQVLSLYK